MSLGSFLRDSFEAKPVFVVYDPETQIRDKSDDAECARLYHYISIICKCLYSINVCIYGVYLPVYLYACYIPGSGGSPLAMAPPRLCLWREMLDAHLLLMNILMF